MYKTFFRFSAGIVLALQACQTPASAPTGSSAQQAVGARLVTVLPLTGALAANGPSREKAARLAADHINQAGGLASGRLQLDHLDSGTQAARAQAQLQAYIAAEGAPDVLIGASSSQVSRQLLQEAGRGGFPMISPASTAASFTTKDPDQLFFRTAPSDAFQSTILADRIYESGVRRLGVIYLDDAYGSSLKNTLQKAFVDQGGEVVASVPYQPDQTEALSAALGALWSQALDGVCLVGYPQEAPQIFNHWLASGLQSELRWFFSDGLKSAETLAGVSAPFRLDQSLGTVPSALPQEASARFEQDYLAAYQGVPVSFAAHTYDAVVLAALALQLRHFQKDLSWPEALQQVSGPPGKLVGPGELGLKEALRLLAEGQAINYEGASGSVDFDAVGDVLSDYEIWTFKSGFIFRVETRSPSR